MGAAVRGHTESVRALLEKGADVNAKGNTGRTALMEAALEGYTDTVRTLLEKGADVNAKDNMGWTPLFWAAFSRRTDTVRALLEKGADVNAKNKYDDTPLIHAAYAGDTDTVAVLLEKGADVNAKDDMGRTALIEAARQGRTETVRALLEVGADVTTRDKEGETALSKAEKHSYSDVIALLKNPAGILQSKKLRKPSTGTPDASPAVTPPNSSPVATGDGGLEKEPSAQSFYRMGLNMRLIEVLWSQTGELAARCAVGLQQDLKKVAAPGDLIELANRAAIQLKLGPRERDSSVPILIRELRVRLDKLCKAKTEEQFFCTAGAFTYDLTLFGEDVKDPGHAKVSVEDGRRKTLLLTSALAAQCSASAGCKDRALLYFTAAANILKKEQLVPADGSLLVTVSENIGKALGSNER
jgi:ankyrin repeat protein